MNESIGKAVAGALLLLLCPSIGAANAAGAADFGGAVQSAEAADSVDIVVAAITALEDSVRGPEGRRAIRLMRYAVAWDSAT